MRYSLKKILKITLLQPYRIPPYIICLLRSRYYTRMIDTGSGKIIITKPFIKLKIRKHKTSHLHIQGRFRITPFLDGTSPIIISMNAQSELVINGDFLIGNGVKLHLSEKASLVIGGKDKESESGITADSLIMVDKKINIGKDFICAWNVFISDSDWHQIGSQPAQKDLHIGDHVWIANSCSILKGSYIGNNSIIASHSKVINTKYEDNSLLAGSPATVVKSGITWTRDIKTLTEQEPEL